MDFNFNDSDCQKIAALVAAQVVEQLKTAGYHPGGTFNAQQAEQSTPGRPSGTSRNTQQVNGK